MLFYISTNFYIEELIIDTINTFVKISVSCDTWHVQSVTQNQHYEDMLKKSFKIFWALADVWKLLRKDCFFLLGGMEHILGDRYFIAFRQYKLFLKLCITTSWKVLLSWWFRLVLNNVLVVIKQLLNQNKSSMSIRVLIRRFEVQICLWCVLSINVLTIIILSNVKFCFWFSNVLDMTDPTLHKIYQ